MTLGEEGGEDRSPPFRLDVANSAWGQEGLRFERAYLETLAGQYGVAMRPVDFGQTDKASRKINARVEDEAGGRIRNLIAPEVVSRDTRLVLASAVYFKASWLSSFEERKTKDGPLTLPDGDAVTVPLMRQRSYLPYAEGEGYQAVRLPYRGGVADMMVVLPEEGRFGEIENRLGAGLLEGVEENMRPNEFVKLTMPRYDFETSMDLIPLLQSMGMKVPFDSGAAAATSLAMPTSKPPPSVEMSVDRPFLFAITERQTGAVLFLGRVTDPSWVSFVGS